MIIWVRRLVIILLRVIRIWYVPKTSPSNKEFLLILFFFKQYWNVGEGCVDSHNRGVSPEGMNQVCSMLAKEEYGEEYDAQANCAY